MKTLKIRAGIQNGVMSFRVYLLVHAGKKVIDFSYLKLKRPTHSYLPIISPVELHHLRPTYGLRWRRLPGTGVGVWAGELPFERKEPAPERMTRCFSGRGTISFADLD